ncbi:cytochrome P450 [Lophiotrema nucula]|uniref:Cytochrome P450 n=1 Tax=Lophiotrema nucula TaxID=690887 RepID=A0A6A5ZT01_9PLEO|nr:cytochrome P450 [Lophiotrema nucula]
MFATLVLSLAALPATFLVWSALSFRSNLIKARAIGLPVLVRYVTPSNLLWMAWGSKLVRLARRLGIATENFDRFYLFGWEGNERYKVYAQLGDAFTLVTPGGNWIYVADPDAVWEALKRPREFGRNLEQLAVLDVYGRSLSTTEGQEWQKHRKITAATFTEKNNEFVWHSSLAQAKGMLEYWMHRAPQPVRSVAEDCKTFTLNVLAAALFSKPYPFEGLEEMQQRRSEPSENSDGAYQYRDSLSRKQTGEAVADFRSYVLNMVEEEKANVENGNTGRRDLVSALVRASLKQRKAGRDMTVTEEEIVSNTFVYGFAGNDTTAITLAHTIVNLAAYPRLKDWIAEEICQCQAVIMEFLRLCHSLGSSSKLTKEATSLTVNGKRYVIPQNTNVQLNFCGLHTNAKIRGESALDWNPARFIEPTNEQIGSSIKSERLRQSPEKKYLPWSWGERVCPGKRFSQVELTATLAVLFREHHVDPVPETSESIADSRKRAQRISMDIQMTLLNEMYKSERVGLRWMLRNALW